MSSGFFTINENATCGSAIATLQERGEDVDSVFYVYVTSVTGVLTGVVSLRQLLVHPASTALVSIMIRDVITAYRNARAPSQGTAPAC